MRVGSIEMNNIVRFCRHYSNVLILIAVLIGSGIFSHLLTGEYSIDGGRKQIGLTAKLMLAFSYSLSLGLILLYWQEFKQKIGTISWLWGALILWAAVSVVLGQFNMHTVMRLMGLVGCTLIGFMLFVCTQNLRHVVLLMFWVCLSIIIINLFYIDGSILMDVSAKNVKGVFGQKNSLGHYSVLTMFLCVFTYLATIGRVRWLSALLLITASWLLLLSSSMTSYVLVPVAVFVGVSTLIISRYQRGGLAIAGVSIFLACMLAWNWPEFSSLIGRDPTFTGRTNHWAEYWSLIEQRMVIGHGYGAYPEKQIYWLLMGPHNGYIGVLYQTGIIGLLMILALVAASFKNLWNIISKRKFVFESYFLSGFLIVFLTLNLVETYIYHRSGVYWPLFVYATLQLAWLQKQTKDGISTNNDTAQ